MHIPMRLLMIITATSLAGLLVAAEPKKLPIPDPDQQRSVHADVRTLFRGEYAKKTAADIRAFAAKLCNSARKPKATSPRVSC